MHKYRIFTFMNLIYILYIAHNKVDLVAQLLPFNLEVKGFNPEKQLPTNIQN